MASVLDHEDEVRRHFDQAVLDLSESNKEIDPQVVRRVVGEAFEDLSDSRIKNFVPVLARRRASERLAAMRWQAPPPRPGE